MAYFALAFSLKNQNLAKTEPKREKFISKPTELLTSTEMFPGLAAKLLTV